MPDVIVGAPTYDAGESDEGAAFVFLGRASGVASGTPATAATRLESDQAGALLGGSVAGAGDVNGDGYGDVIAGAENYGAGQSQEGAAFVFLGSAAGIANGNPGSAATQIEANQATALLGGSVPGRGDTNGDGYADVIVGARLYDAGQADEGAAFVFLGSASGVADGNPVTAAAQLESDQGASQFGSSVSGAGDTNGDGYADVIVGAHQYDAGQTDEGAAFVFRGSASGVADGGPATAAAQLESNQGSARAGFRVAAAGDVNGDGYGDVIVSSYCTTPGPTTRAPCSSTTAALRGSATAARHRVRAPGVEPGQRGSRSQRRGRRRRERRRLRRRDRRRMALRCGPDRRGRRVPVPRQRNRDRRRRSRHGGAQLESDQAARAWATASRAPAT
jgi:hypothetical protein